MRNSSAGLTHHQLHGLLRLFTARLSLNPNNLILQIKVAEVLQLLGRDGHAIAIFNSVACSYATGGNFRLAIDICKHVLLIDSAHADTTTMLTILYRRKRERQKKQSVRVNKVGARWIAGAMEPLTELRI